VEALLGAAVVAEGEGEGGKKNQGTSQRCKYGGKKEEKRRRKEACSAFTIAYASIEWKKVEREKTLEVKN